VSVPAAGAAGRGHGAVTRHGDGGSVLMLVPAAVLIVLVMAAIAVDMSLLHLRRRQAHDLAAAAANDAATAAADQAALRDGDYVLDEDAAGRVAVAVVEASDRAPEIASAPQVRIVGEVVEVEVALEADYIFAGVVPGAPDGRTVRATARATAVGPAG
jgi:hypothetical protein